eukprot:CAMPEP_0117752828 /NCGR_PEP_ID=MMETSP0947-20121206/11857_1 /TAXON_ID=44440 /ORGANISM="Chattonella subsalsa, Strain CCMP2191" /LENGTH=591 /DNA_ID=CAMNT_0005571583 /DNA_START=328 /DNA_END=2103 /DNA_ORIENTATION=+
MAQMESTSSSTDESEMTLANAIPIKARISNKYIQRDGEPSWKYPWLIPEDSNREQILLAEPHIRSEISIEAEDKSLESSLDLNRFEWFVISPEGKFLEHHSGSNALGIIFEDLGVHAVIIRQYSGDGVELSVTRVKVIVKYVRREIRSLIEEDLEATLDAMATLWRVPQDLGRSLYGEKYFSAEELLKVHLKLAGAKECDHMHDGMGFVPHHMALTLLFEQSLQAVNPKIALPYWDYSIDFESITTAEDQEFGLNNFANSELFSEKYFGATDPETHRISSGRWQGLMMPTTNSLSGNEAEVIPHNSFGYLRAPWSSNSDPYLLRSSTMCGLSLTDYLQVSDCSSFQRLMTTSTLEQFAKFVSYDPHGPVHILLGGTLNCEESYARLHELFDEDQANDFTSFAFGFHKNLYRWGILTCEEGQEYCSCPDLDYFMETKERREMFFLRAKDNLDTSLYSTDQLELLADVICNSKLVNGDQLQASSAFAPEFWPIHPTVERAYQWKKISIPFEEEVWMHGSATWMDDAYDVEFCSGHRADDKVLDDLLPVGLYFGQKTAITNQDYFKIMDPNLDVLPYVYDNFDWNHCEAFGFLP